MSGSVDSPQALPTLATRQLPRRVRDLLKGVLELASGELTHSIALALDDFERQLSGSAEQAHNYAEQAPLLKALRSVKRDRRDLTSDFLIALEAELSALRDPPETQRRRAKAHESDVAETGLLSEISNRAELHNSLPLYLLGQRFGVLAGRPAMSAETLPIAPQALCRMIREVCDGLPLGDEQRAMFFRCFDAQVMPAYGRLVEAINQYLAKSRVLPHLRYVPVDARPASPEASISTTSVVGTTVRGLGIDAGPIQTPLRDSSLEHRTGPPATRAPDTAKPIPSPSTDPEQGFQELRRLLGERRKLLNRLASDTATQAPETTHVLSSVELQRALANAQSKPAVPVVVKGKTVPRSISHLKQDLLVLLRNSAPEQRTPVLAAEDNDTIDLVAMLYDSLMKELTPNNPVSELMTKLQAPLLRIALQDKSLFVDPGHPARRMLDTLADIGVSFLGEGETDDGSVAKMNSAVDRTVREFDGDLRLFDDLLEDLSLHQQMIARKAEVAERRHVEAARGKEKLALARQQAHSAVESLLKRQSLPRFTHTLLSEAWADVMALTALRQGADSEAWKLQLDIAERVIRIACAPAAESPSTANRELRGEIEQALSQVGYQGEDASAIALRLVDPQSGNESDAASRTELTMRLKARTRLGSDLSGPSLEQAPFNPAERESLTRLREIPIGTWFEFANLQGQRLRRRLSWYSTVTGQVLLVNHRGQKNDEFTLASLARWMAKGDARIVEETQASVGEHAWNALVGTLRTFSDPDASRRLTQ